jgi:hypothetical protein
MWMDFVGRLLPDNEDRDGPENIGLFAIQLHDEVTSQRIFY